MAISSTVERTLGGREDGGELVRHPTVHPGVPTSIRHWQLRDLICAGNIDDEVISVMGTTAVRYSLKTMEKTATTHLDFFPNSICYSPGTGYMAVGGQGAELEVIATRSEVEEVLFRGNTEGSVHNALHIGTSTSGDPLLFASNNDSTVKVFHLPSMQRASVVRCQVPINYTALSPCGRTLCCVGDVTAAILHQATESGYQRVSSFTEADDAGMCCAFAPGLGCLAASFQDGTVVIWDYRGGKLIHKYKLAGASRSCKFGQGPLDVLAFTEHDDRAWVVDTRKWDAMQRLDVGQMITGALEVAAAEGRSRQQPQQQPQHPHLAQEQQQRMRQYGYERLVAARIRVGRLPLLLHQASPHPGVGHRGSVDISGIAFGSGGSRLVVGTDEGIVAYELNAAERCSFPSGQLA